MRYLKNIKLIIEYDGSMYHGWQIQPNVMTIQGKIEQAIYNLTDEKVNLIGASRTDEGVHAVGQVANFFTNSSIPPEKFANAINHFLPSDIAVIKSQQVGGDFHSRYNSKGKKYRYVIYNRYHRSPIFAKRAYHVKHDIDIGIMKDAAKFLIGEHDFSSFRASGGSAKTSIRTIYGIDIKRDGNLVIIDVLGSGFLYNMVRIIVGTLVDISIRKSDACSMKKVLEAKNRKKAGKTAPSHGLYLMEISY